MNKAMAELGVSANVVFRIIVAHELGHAVQRSEVPLDTWNEEVNGVSGAGDYRTALATGKTLSNFSTKFKDITDYRMPSSFYYDPGNRTSGSPPDYIEAMVIAASVNMYAPEALDPALQKWANTNDFHR